MLHTADALLCGWKGGRDTTGFWLVKDGGTNFLPGMFPRTLKKGMSARWKKKCQNRQDSLRLENQMQPIGACERSHAAHEEKRGKHQEKRKHGDIVCEVDISYWLHFNKGGVVISTLH